MININELKKSEYQLNQIKVEKVKNYLIQIELLDMFDEMTFEQKLDYYANQLDNTNLFVMEHDLRTRKNVKLANLVAEFGSGQELKSSILANRNMIPIEDTLWSYRDHIFELKLDKQQISLEQLKDSLENEEFMNFKHDLEILLLQSLDLDELASLIEMVDRNINVLDKLYAIHNRNTNLRFNEILEVINCDDPVLNYWLGVTGVSERGNDIVELFDDEIYSNEYLKYEVAEKEDLILSDPLELGSKLINTKEGVVYYLERKILEDEQFIDEDEDNATFEWVLV
jgi:hypothetical protein